MPKNHRTFELADLDGINGFTINGITAGDNSGFSGASLGDINGDDFDDLIVGARGANEQSGQNYILFGRPGVWPPYFELSELDGSNGVTLNGIAVKDYSGFSAPSSGDVNNDGVRDIMIGAHGANHGGKNNAGQSYLIFGRKDPWPSKIELSKIDGVIGTTVNGIAADDWSGVSVNIAGDVNGDGIADVMIGASGADPRDRSKAGQCYLIFGHASTWPATLELSILNGINGVTFDGIQSNDKTGQAVSHAGDVNGDGIDDMMIGAYLADPGGRIEAGQSYLIFGSNKAWPASIELSALNGINSMMINGITKDDHSGYCIATAGDINGDGIDDIIIGAHGTDASGRRDSGQAYLVFGQVGNWPKTLELSELNGSNGVMINGIASNDQAGVSVHAAGDLNDDGLDDMIIGANKASPGGRSHAGQSYVLFGHIDPWPAIIELSSLNGVNGVMLNGITAGDQSGRHVGTAGDLNSDGFVDIIVGAFHANPSNTRTNAGQSYVIFGGPEQFSANQLAIHADGHLRLNGSHLSVDPVVGSRVFTIENIQHGQFELVNDPSVAVTQFTQQQINDGEVILYHDSSEFAPSYTVSAERITRVFSDVKPLAAQVTLLPSLLTKPSFIHHQLRVEEGETLIISPQMLLAENQDNTTISFNVTDVTHGMFVDAQNTPVSTFTQQQVNKGAIRFVHDGSNEAPSYAITASSGGWATSIELADTTFTPINDAPVLVNNQFVVHEGESLVITPNELSAWDEETPDDELTYIVHHVEHGEFRTKTINGPIGIFSQKDITNGYISLVADNTGLPLAANISVSDGSLISRPVGADITFIPSSAASKETTSSVPYIMGIVLVLAGMCFLGATLYLLLRCLGDSRLNKAFSRPTTDQGHSPKLLKQLSKALFAATNIRNFGHISANQAMAYQDAIKAIVTELSTQKPDFDFDTLTTTWQQIWLDVLVRAIRSELMPDASTSSHHPFRLFKAKIQPEQIRSAAYGITKRAIDDMTNTDRSSPTLNIDGNEAYQALDGSQQLYAASQM